MIMIHFGKTPQGELEIRAAGADIGVIYRAICSSALLERCYLYPMKEMIEREFVEEIKQKGGHHA